MYAATQTIGVIATLLFLISYVFLLHSNLSVINFVFFQILNSNCTTFDAGKKAGFLLVIKMHKCANVQLNVNQSLWWIIISLIASQITYLIALKQLCQSQWCWLLSDFCRVSQTECHGLQMCSQRQMLYFLYNWFHLCVCVCLFKY